MKSTVPPSVRCCVVPSSLSRQRGALAALVRVLLLAGASVPSPRARAQPARRPPADPSARPWRHSPAGCFAPALSLSLAMADVVPAGAGGGHAGDAAAPAVAAAGGPAAAAAARQARADRFNQMKAQREDLKKEQKRLATQLKKEQQAHQRAVKKMRTLPTEVILQCLRERGENV